MVATNKSQIVREIPAACADETAAVEFMERQRWGDDPNCPRCESRNVYIMRGRDGKRQKEYRWYCRGCSKKYTMRIGTVLEDSRIPLMYWCYAFWRACSSKKGVSAKEIERQTGLSYKTALFLLNRIRYAMTDDDGEMLTGDVEVDETWVGGKPRYRKSGQQGMYSTKKATVMLMVERGGRARTPPIPNVTGNTLRSVIYRNVHPEARIFTDEHSGYKKLSEAKRTHITVNHSKREYVRGDAYTNTAESFFAIVKRGLNGIYHAVSKDHLHRYMSEFTWRYNHRKLEDGERTVAAIRAAIGKRLMYRQPEMGRW